MAERANARPLRQRGRLLFALDATMSRQPTWDMACQLQAEMFEAVAKTGGLDVQLHLFPRLWRMPGVQMGVGCAQPWHG